MSDSHRYLTLADPSTVLPLALAVRRLRLGWRAVRRSAPLGFPAVGLITGLALCAGATGAGGTGYPVGLQLRLLHRVWGTASAKYEQSVLACDAFLGASLPL